MMHWDGGGWWTMALWMSMFWVLVLGVVAWAVMRAFPKGRRRDADPREVLDRRFADGEIDAEAYRAGIRRLTEAGVHDR